MPKIRVSFYMTGDDLDLDLISSKLNILPTETRKKSDWPAGAIIAGVARDAWLLQTEKDECKAVAWQFQKLMDKLLPQKNVINELCKEYEIKTNVTVVIEMQNGDGPEIVLTKEITRFLADINAEAGFDLYID